MRISLCFLARNGKDVEAMVEENSALADKDTLFRMYGQATREQFSFLYIDLMQADPSLAFFRKFDARLVPDE